MFGIAKKVKEEVSRQMSEINSSMYRHMQDSFRRFSSEMKDNIVEAIKNQNAKLAQMDGFVKENHEFFKRRISDLQQKVGELKSSDTSDTGVLHQRVNDLSRSDLSLRKRVSELEEFKKMALKVMEREFSKEAKDAKPKAAKKKTTSRMRGVRPGRKKKARSASRESRV